MEEKCLGLETFERKGPDSITKAYELKRGKDALHTHAN